MPQNLPFVASNFGFRWPIFSLESLIWNGSQDRTGGQGSVWGQGYLAPNIYLSHQTLLLATKVSFLRRFFEEIGEKVSRGKKKWHKTLLLATKHLPKPQNIVISHQIFATKWSFFG